MTFALWNRALPRTPPSSLPERMDDPDCDPEVLRDALEVIDRAGRWSGRDQLLVGDVRRLVSGLTPGGLALLDVGAGAGAGGLRLARRLNAYGWRPHLVLADLHPGALRIAREGQAIRSARSAGFVRLDAPHLPFADRAFDIAVSTATLHHLEDSDAPRLLAELARVSRLGFSVVDLRRSRFVYAITRGLAVTAWRNRPFPRWDGPVSVRRAFTPAEARQLLRAAGLDDGVVRAWPAWISIRWARRGLAGTASRARSSLATPLPRSLVAAATTEP